MLYFSYTVLVGIQLCSYNLQHADGLALQLAPTPLVSSSFIITFFPYIRMYVLAFRGHVGACGCFAYLPSKRAARYSFVCLCGFVYTHLRGPVPRFGGTLFLT